MKTIVSTFCLLLCSVLSYAQLLTVSGIVTDENGKPLSQVKVISLSSQEDVETSEDGRYILEVQEGEDLLFKYPKYGLVKAKAYGRVPVHIQMNPANPVAEGKAEEKAFYISAKRMLAYQVGFLDEDVFEENVQSDFTRILSGKTSGIQITPKSGLSGSFNQVVIRGRQTINGDNNALYVIDGVPYSKDINENCPAYNGPHASSRSFDIDPNNILKVAILKGLAATNLYGSEGKNGVILITTKSGGITTR